jgi:hypothetical protein
MAGLFHEAQIQQRQLRPRAAGDEFAARTGEAALRLERLVTGVRDLIGLEEGTLSFTLDCVSPEALTRQVVESLRPDAAARGCELTLRVSGMAATAVSLDSGRYARLIRVLLRRTLLQISSGAVAVSLDVAERSAGPCLLTLDIRALARKPNDDGRRIESIVETGSSLALLLCRRMVELMHGTLRTSGSPTQTTLQLLVSQA